jgi:hypothetical protein
MTENLHETEFFRFPNSLDIMGLGINANEIQKLLLK